MKSYKDYGIPFRQIDIGEADRIFSILTKYHGRVEAIGKGIRKITSRRAGNIELMSLSTISFAIGKELDIITEAKLTESYPLLKENYNDTTKLLYLCELLDKFLIKGEDDRQIYSYLLSLLKALLKTKSTFPIRSFELKLLKITGYDPIIDRCSSCDNFLVENEKRYSYINKIGFYCEREKRNTGIPISDKLLKILKFLKENSIEESGRLKKDENLEMDLSMLLQNWIETITEKNLKSKSVIN